MKKATIFITLTTSALLTGCWDEANTVEYYMKNEEARTAKIKECINNPGELENTPNCENAMTAQVRSEFSSKGISMPSIK